MNIENQNGVNDSSPEYLIHDIKVIPGAYHEFEENKDDEWHRLKDWVYYAEGLIISLLPPEHRDVFVYGSLIGVEHEDEDRRILEIEIDFNSKEAVGLFLGYKLSNLRALLHMLRFQCFCPHNYFIRCKIYTNGDNCQTFWNKDVSSNRKRYKDPRERQTAHYKNQLIRDQ